MPATLTSPRTGARRPSVATPPPRRRPFLKFVLFLLGVVTAATLVAAGAVVSQARQYDTTPTDAIVVLGASQYWGEPSPVFANRLEHAARLYRDGVAPVVITVGGGIPGDKTTEAEAGAQYLARLGVPESAVVAIPRGSDTVTSLTAVARRADEQRWHSLTVVSDRAHLARSSAIADSLGFEARANGPASGDGSLLTPEYVAREAAGLVRFTIWDRWLLQGVG